MHALIAQGVRHFPHPTQPEVASAPAETTTPMEAPASSGATQPLSPVAFLQEARNCDRCPLVLTRKRVVVSESIAPSPIMVLADFPAPGDEDAAVKSTLFEAPESAASVLARLLDRLELGDSVHRSFAIKCVPRKGISNESLPRCAPLLAREIELVNPDIILAFGHRSLAALEQVAGTRFPQSQELGNLGRAPIGGKERQIFSLPSARELELFKEWRGPVWSFLQILKAPPP
jgi:uracil-DNA glycosylase